MNSKVEKQAERDITPEELERARVRVEADRAAKAKVATGPISAQQALAYVQTMKNVLLVLEHGEAALTTVAEAEQLLRESEARLTGVKAEEQAVRDRIVAAKTDFDAQEANIKSAMDKLQVEYAQYVADLASYKAQHTAEVNALIEKRDTLAGAIKSLQESLKQTAADAVGA